MTITPKTVQHLLKGIRPPCPPSWPRPWRNEGAADDPVGAKYVPYLCLIWAILKPDPVLCQQPYRTWSRSQGYCSDVERDHALKGWPVSCAIWEKGCLPYHRQNCVADWLETNIVQTPAFIPLTQSGVQWAMMPSEHQNASQCERKQEKEKEKQMSLIISVYSEFY